MFILRCMRYNSSIIEGMNGSSDNGGSSWFGGNDNNNNGGSSFFGGNNNDNNNNNSSSYFGGNNSNDPQALAIEKIADAIKADADKINDALLLDKYKTNYEDIIINLESVITNTMISSLKPISLTISKDPTSVASQTAMVKLENLNKFRSTLEDIMNALDKTTSFTSGASGFFGGNSN